MKCLKSIMQIVFIIATVLLSNVNLAKDTKKNKRDVVTYKEQIKLIVNKYLKLGYKIYGPYKVDKVRNGYAYLFSYSPTHKVIDLFKSKEINEKEEDVSIYKGDKVYLFKKNRQNILLKLKKGKQNDY